MANSPKLPQILWKPELAGHTSMYAYRRHINAGFSQTLQTTADVHRWSTQDPQNFWMDL